MIDRRVINGSSWDFRLSSVKSLGRFDKNTSMMVDKRDDLNGKIFSTDGTSDKYGKRCRNGRWKMRRRGK